MRSKLTTLDKALAPIETGCSIAIGGALLRRPPNAAVRHLIRKGVKDLTVLGWVSTTAIDLLAAADAVNRYEGAYAAMFSYGLAPNFRRGVESGRITVRDFSESTMVARYRAASAGLPFYPSRALLGTDLARHNEDQIRDISCPFTGEKLHAIAAAHSDFTLIHGYEADEYGNVQCPVVRDSDDIDQMMASAAKRLIVTVERIVPADQIVKQPTRTYIPSTWVESLVVVPYGAHPVACDAFYDEDEAHLIDYMSRCKTIEGARGYIDEFVNTVASHEDYLDKVGKEHLARLDVRASQGTPA